MNHDEQSYLGLLKHILENGDEKLDRTNTGTKSVFGTQLRFSLEDDTVPMLTTKKMFSKGIIEELLFFIRGETDTKLLEAKGVNIWKGNTSREFLNSRGLNHLPEGSLGKGYGFQWRNFGGSKPGPDGHFGSCLSGLSSSAFPCDCDERPKGIDQLEQVFNTLKTNPDDRRMIITAWNPQQLDDMALPPCHMTVQFYVSDGKLSAQWYQRSVDSFLGLPFNILSYSIFTRIMAQAVGMKAKEVIFTGGDTHIYNNHIDQVKEQISREPFNFPKMKINKELKTIADMEALEYKDFEFTNYNSHPAIKAVMAV